MRISDWSSDVCSSDLGLRVEIRVLFPVVLDQDCHDLFEGRAWLDDIGIMTGQVIETLVCHDDAVVGIIPDDFVADAGKGLGQKQLGLLEVADIADHRNGAKSDELTSELQSIMHK